ncbi:TIGR01841 family phasin [uncultured Pseudacidovorax sp.]|uniref:TIGR01841 family phasin n=1 Tax=uncultured Pseudacidovorax sp. TaxID=679313 RepID=UPI0025E80A76|nr:TIGR01841 family phasin [uncultured Pseudacidovorax sp.]
MATRKTSSSTSAGSAGSLPDPMAALAGMQEAASKSLQEMAQRMQGMDVTGTAALLLENSRKDMEAMVKASSMAREGLQSVVQRQTEMLKQSIEQWRDTLQSMPGQDMKAQLGKIDSMGRASFQQALEDIRELADLTAKSQTEAFEIVRQRVNENVEQARQLLAQGMDAHKKR